MNGQMLQSTVEWYAVLKGKHLAEFLTALRYCHLRSRSSAKYSVFHIQKNHCNCNYTQICMWVKYLAWEADNIIIQTDVIGAILDGRSANNDLQSSQS